MRSFTVELVQLLKSSQQLRRWGCNDISFICQTSLGQYTKKLLMEQEIWVDKEIWEDSIKEWKCLNIAKSQRAIEDVVKWREYVMMSSKLPVSSSIVHAKWGHKYILLFGYKKFLDYFELYRNGNVLYQIVLWSFASTWNCIFVVVVFFKSVIFDAVLLPFGSFFWL